ncbi:hypothetical protein E4K10_18085 [Streptomyces sp. T1317-0309]|nr:hypothetical protein E4K10_18085 [Streptomyces sp. T1317-0309]
MSSVADLIAQLQAQAAAAGTGFDPNATDTASQIANQGFIDQAQAFSQAAANMAQQYGAGISAIINNLR